MNQLTHAQFGALVKKAQQGDTSAFAALYAATIESQLYFATTFLKDASLAEDAVQEVYISLYNNLHKILDGNLFIAYLRRICYNTCVDFRRRQSRQHYELDEHILLKQTDTDMLGSPHERYAVLEERNELHKALAKLPDEERAAFLMRYYDEFKIAEIALAMNLSESTVKRYIRKAVNRLREIL